MSDRSRNFTETDLTALHSASMALLERHGLAIKDEAVLDFFKKRGFLIDGHQVKITEAQVQKALDTAPERFTIRARNPENNVEVGGPNPALSGTGGPTLIVQANGVAREATLDDYKKFCKLIQTSPVAQILPHEMIHPMDIPAPASHLDMLWLDATMCDRALTGDTQDVTTTRDTMMLLSLLFGGADNLKSSAPASINIINPLSPLGFAPDQAEALMVLAEHNQAVAITNMIMLGSTAPVDLASALALGNAELLGGIVLSQLVRPGAPVVYGSTSCPLEMRVGLTSLGRPETMLYIQATTALARFYKIPSRAGGGLTDAHVLDSQAAFESALLLKTAFDNGVDYVLHAFGMMGSYMAASLEKWVVDEEIARLLLASREAARFNHQTIEVDYMVEMGAGANYLKSPKTFKSFRSLYQGGFLNVESQAAWKEGGSLTSVDKAQREVERRLASYQPPPMDQGLKAEVESWITRRKKEIAG